MAGNGISSWLYDRLFFISQSGANRARRISVSFSFPIQEEEEEEDDSQLTRWDVGGGCFLTLQTNTRRPLTTRFFFFFLFFVPSIPDWGMRDGLNSQDMMIMGPKKKKKEKKLVVVVVVVV